MDGNSVTLVIALLFIILLLIIGLRSSYISGTIKTPFISGVLNSRKSGIRGSAEVSDLRGKNIKVNTVIGAEGEHHESGEATVKNLKAEGDIEIDSVIGSSSHNQGK